MNLELTKEEISTLSTIPKDDTVTSNTPSKKRSTDGQPKVPEEDINNQIIFQLSIYEQRKSTLATPLTVLQPSHTKLNVTPTTALY